MFFFQRTPLIEACSNAHIAIVKNLVKLGANVNETDKRGVRL